MRFRHGRAFHLIPFIGLARRHFHTHIPDVYMSQDACRSLAIAPSQPKEDGVASVHCRNIPDIDVLQRSAIHCLQDNSPPVCIIYLQIPHTYIGKYPAAGSAQLEGAGAAADGAVCNLDVLTPSLRALGLEADAIVVHVEK